MCPPSIIHLLSEDSLRVRLSSAQLTGSLHAQPDWTLYVEVDDHVNFTKALNADIGKPKYNATEGDKRIPLTTLRSNQTLLAGHKNAISMGVLLQATSQA